MSDALRHQVKEWRKKYQLQPADEQHSGKCDGDNQGGSSEPEPELSDMKKMQAMHLQIRELKKENELLKESLRRKSNHGGYFYEGEVVRKQAANNHQHGRDDRANDHYCNDHSDDQSNLTGFASSSKLIDAMSGFLHDYESTSPS